VHEYSLVEALIRRVEEEAASRKALAVHQVRVALGELAGVDHGLFRTAYETFREGSICHKATLDVRTVQATYRCPGCGRTFSRGEPLQCAACQLPARLEDGGDALMLEAIDMEVP
jgi:hydrogenase nickel incorporation protein HypA/HybF